MPPPFADPAALSELAPPASTTVADGGRARPVVLVVDDEREVVTALEAALGGLGYQVASACNGADAFDKALALRPLVVISDLLMPVVDGIALAKALRCHAGTAETRIVLSSGVPEGNVRVLFSGYDAFLQKPYELADLRETLAALMRI